MADASSYPMEGEDGLGHAKTQYNDIANNYSQYSSNTEIPQAILESQLFAAALSEVGVQGKHILDLGGGNGVHARQALEMGAAGIDVVDISAEMLEEARTAEKKIGREDAMRFFVADAATDLSHLGLRPRYDVVLIGWLLDHAQSDADLDGFWRNILAFTAPGGAVVVCRVVSLQARSWITQPDYGIQLRNVREIPGGLAYQVHLLPPAPNFDFGATTMNRSMGLVPTMYEQYGFTDVKRIPFDSVSVVRDDPAFWKGFLDDPFFCIEHFRTGS